MFAYINMVADKKTNLKFKAVYEGNNLTRN